MPSIILKSSPLRCCPVPGPAEPNDSPPLVERASWTRSSIERHLDDGSSLRPRDSATCRRRITYRSPLRHEIKGWKHEGRTIAVRSLFYGGWSKKDGAIRLLELADHLGSHRRAIGRAL